MHDTMRRRRRCDAGTLGVNRPLYFYACVNYADTADLTLASPMWIGLYSTDLLVY